MLIKTTKSAKLITAAAQLKSVTARRAALESLEDELKAFFKSRLGITEGAPPDDIALNAGDNVLLIKRCSRTYLKRELLSAELGEDLSRFERDTEYAEVTVKAREDHDPAQTAKGKAA